MLRRATLVLSLLSLSLPCYARFYAGIGTGPVGTNFAQTAYVLHLPDTNVKDTTHFAGRGYFGSLFAGYYWDCYKQFYLAGEINADLSSDEFHSSNDDYIHKNFGRTRYKMGDRFGFSLLPGYLYTQTLLFYARLGYSNSNFKISTTDNSLSNVDKRLNGIRYGLGVKNDFTPTISGRMEYSHTDYATTSFNAFPPGTVKRTSISPSTSQFELAVIYNFC